jgi:hypothetical protein
MPPTNTVGRPQSIIWEYIDKRDTDDDDDDISCSNISAKAMAARKQASKK